MTTFKIVQGDCLALLTDLTRESIDVIVTSPPYNIGIKYRSYDDNKPFLEYLEWIEALGKACKKVLKEKGSFFLNIGDRASDEFSRSFEVASRLAEIFKLQNTIHWIKHVSVPEEKISIGHFKPINSPRFLNNCHEYIFHFTKNNDVSLDKLAIGVPYKDKSNIKRWKKNTKDLRDRGNVWFIPYETTQTKRAHPASFPVNLPKMCIKLHGLKKKLVVLDPLCGSGTTGIAALELGCDFLGFEIDEHYCSLANSRLNSHIKQTRLEDF